MFPRLFLLIFLFAGAPAWPQTAEVCGDTKNVTYEIKTTDSDLNALLASGLIGTLVRYSGGSQFDAFDVSVRGEYFKLQQLNGGKPKDWLLFNDPRSVNLIQKLLAQPVPVLLTSDYEANGHARPFLGLVPLYKDEFQTAFGFCEKTSDQIVPPLVLTPKADYYVLRHELVHHRDVVHGTIAKIKSAVLKTFNGESPASQFIEEFIIEHRSYFIELAITAKDRENGMLTDKTSYEDSVIALLSGYKRKMKNYADPKSDSYQKIVELLKTYCPIEGAYGLRELFPEFFSSEPRN